MLLMIIARDDNIFDTSLLCLNAGFRIKCTSVKIINISKRGGARGGGGFLGLSLIVIK